MSQEHSPATSHAQPLTRQKIEDWREVFDRQYADLSKLTSNALEFSIARVHLHQLCDMALSALSETPQKPIAWRWRIVSIDEIPWLYATEKPNNLNDELFWDVEPLFAASAHSAIACKWIPCSERLPEIRGDYLTWWEDQGRATIIGYNKGWMWGDGSRMRDSKHVTHWMLTPEAP